MKQLQNNFRIYCNSNQTWVNHYFDHEELVNDYMFINNLYGVDIFDALIEESKKFNNFE